jgi:DNA polymerase-3 subunit epsilon
MEIHDFTAIDFETATGSRNSACAVGVVRYENGKIVYKNHFYIKPPDNKYSYRNVMVHGIYSKTTADAPTFDIVWKKIEPYIENQIVVAHNASFDRSVLKESLDYYGILSPEILWECTYKLTGTNLEDACGMYDVDLLNHHNALDDTLACGNLFLKLLTNYKPNSLHHNTNRKRRSTHEDIPKELHKPNLEIADKKSLFYNKHIVISGVFRNYTRNEIAEIIHKEGAYIQSAVSGKTDYVLAGANMGPAKKQKAESLGIPIISEEDFEEMIVTK